MAIRPTVLYGVECWLVKNSHNEDIRGTQGEVVVVDKMWEARLRWFEHKNRKTTDALVRMCEKLAVMGFRRGRGRPRKNWGD
ncbi:hypothetical protein H5410_036319 [Solanum commersonii]|uniref:Uncharacterized protein n=1 Tax=Solanum commersonii TaxID=4109 RepID=A0A9J5Y5A6_SOLCO|nr:hypothetical protein H5410_036319 [Solanum commersonii]